jgi:hypothetical protein
VIAQCPKDDGELLLLSLGEISRIRAWRLSRHVASCASCQARQQTLLGTTALFQSVFSPPGRVPAPAPIPWLPVGLSVLGLIALVSLGLWFSSQKHAAVTDIDDGCPPGLHSDRCR